MKIIRIHGWGFDRDLSEGGYDIRPLRRYQQGWNWRRFVRLYEVREPIAYRGRTRSLYGDAVETVVPAGYVTDLASIPRVLHWLMRPDGEYLVWIYSYLEPEYAGEVAIGYGHHAYHHHRGHRVHVPVYEPYYLYREREHLRLEFREDAIVSIERER